MDLTEAFEELERRIGEWVTQLDEATGSSDDDSVDLDIAQMTAELSSSNKTYRTGVEFLNLQSKAAARLAKALEGLTNAINQYLRTRAVSHGTFQVRTGGTGGVLAAKRTPKNLEDLSKLTATLRETLRLLESVQTTLAETISNIQEASRQSDAAQTALEMAKQREEEDRKRWEEQVARDAEEQKRREEEEQRKKEEEEKKRWMEEERRREEEEKRLKREEEERRKREEAEELRRKKEADRIKREAEERRIREEEEQKKREEEERIRKIEEERKQKEEEERRRKEEEEKNKRVEERRLRREEKERRKREKAEAERLAREAEETRRREQEEERTLREEERRWPALVLIVRYSHLHSEHGCAIRAPTGAFISDEFRCTTAPELVKVDSFAASEEVVGNVIRLEAKGRSELGINFRGRRVEWFVSLPHCAQRVPGRETVLYAHKNDSWQELPTDDIQLDGLPGEHRWVETRISEPSIVLVPVNRWKINRFSLTRQGVELVSQMDNRIRLSIPPESFTPRTAVLEQAFEARPIAASVIDSLRDSRPEEFSDLIATSALLKHSSSASKPVSMPMLYTLHVPRNGQKQSAASTANEHSRTYANKSSSILAAASPDISIIANIDTDAIDARWTALEKIVADEATAKERLVIRMTNLASRKVLALRVGKDFDINKLDFVCREIEADIDTQIASLLVGQSAGSRQALVALPSAENTSRMLEMFKSMDFRIVAPAADGDMVTAELKVKERQMLQVDLTGNISSEDGDRFAVMFHSQLCSYRALTLAPKDPYLQTSHPRFRGFVQAFSEFQPTHLAKVPLQLTKLASDRGVGPPWKSPFDYKPKDAVTKEYLQSLASRITDNWPTLAENLGLSKERCSAIKNNGLDARDQALEMLINWLKGTPWSMSKAIVLAKALRSSGYGQLSVELLQKQKRLQEGEEEEDSDDDTE